jgi:chromosome segregation ATPase
MNRMELTLATAVVLFVAFALGWFAHWMAQRLTRVAGGDVSEMDHLAQALHEAEETRDQAIVYLESREAELMSQIASCEAELRATMEGLRDARAETEGLRSYIEKLQPTQAGA